MSSTTQCAVPLHNGGCMALCEHCMHTPDWWHLKGCGLPSTRPQLILSHRAPACSLYSHATPSASRKQANGRAIDSTAEHAGQHVHLCHLLEPCLSTGYYNIYTKLILYMFLTFYYKSFFFFFLRAGFLYHLYIYLYLHDTFFKVFFFCLRILLGKTRNFEQDQ